MDNQPMGQPMMSVPPSMHLPNMPTAQPPRRSRGLMVGLIVTAVVLLLGGGAYFAYSQGYIKLASTSNSNTNTATTNSANTNLPAFPSENKNSTLNLNQSTSNENFATQNINTSTIANGNANVNTSTNTNTNDRFSQMLETDRLGNCYLTKHHDAISFYAAALRSSYQGYVDNPQPDSLCAGFTQSQLDQAGIDIKTDADHDGLNALLEKVYGASDASADTDGDGYGDVQEITNGYNPNGPGLLIDQK